MGELTELQRTVFIFRRSYCGSCFYCGCALMPRWVQGPTGYMKRDPQSITKDHVVPRSRGGKSNRFNMVNCCYKCNQDKGSLTLEEFRARRGGADFFFEYDIRRRMANGSLWGPEECGG